MNNFRYCFAPCLEGEEEGLFKSKRVERRRGMYKIFYLGIIRE